MLCKMQKNKKTIKFVAQMTKLTFTRIHHTYTQKSVYTVHVRQIEIENKRRAYLHRRENRKK